MTKRPTISRSKAFLYWCISLFLFMLLILIPGEIITRLTADNTAYFKKAELDDTLGWRTKEDYSVKAEAKIKRGGTYPVEYNTGLRGFRPYGNPSTTKKKLLIVGDSYTQAVEANNDKTYAAVLADTLEAELFCYGQAGYGTTQEYLLVKEEIDNIKPDLLILQVCGNDFIDNYAPLEMISTYKVGERRPYLDLKGNIYYDKPEPKWQQVVDKSAFLKLLRKKIQTSTGGNKISAQKRINDEGKDFKDYKTSYDLTELGLQKIKSIADERQTPMIVLVAGYIQPYITHMKEICEKNNIPCLTQPAVELRKEEMKNKLPVRCADKYHWTELGHKVIAQNMLDTISTLLNPKAQLPQSTQ